MPEINAFCLSLENNALFCILICLYSFLHELAHYVVACCWGAGGKIGKRGLFGNVLYLGYSLSNLKMLSVYLAGPLLNVVLAVIFIIFMNSGSGWQSEVFSVSAYANIMLAAFNLLPFYPLDGGRALNLLLGELIGYRLSMIISRVFSHFFALSIFILGIYLIKYNPINILLTFDAIYFLFIFERETDEPY